jgi:hypothetical protein
MKTVRNIFEGMLMDRGLSESQSKEVMDMAIPLINPIIGSYDITFDSRASDYPANVYHVVFDVIKPIALKWIEENKPEAWFKPIFSNL